MKIDEPKTPYAKRYEPDEDEDEDGMCTLDAEELMVDELDKARGGGRSRTREAEIPGLVLGEPEIPTDDMVDTMDTGRISRSPSVKGEKQVLVDPSAAEGGEHDGVVRHKEFEEMRKKHYEMKEVKGLLGYAYPLLLLCRLYN